MNKQNAGMTKQEIKGALASTLRSLLAGEIRPDVCDAVSRNVAEQTKLMAVEIVHAKARGEMPFVPELLSAPISTSARLLQKQGQKAT